MLAACSSPLQDAYKSRTNTGASNVLHGEGLEKTYPGKADPCLKARVDIALFPEFVAEKYRYMFEKIVDRAEGKLHSPLPFFPRISFSSLNNNDIFLALNERISTFGEVLTQAHKLTDIVHPSQLIQVSPLQSFFSCCQAQLNDFCLIQSDSVIIGRICCDAEGKLNEASVELESSKELGGGIRTKLDLTQVPSYGLFPGQMVALEGTNISGSLFTATKILQGSPAPMQTSGSTDLLDFNYNTSKMNGKPMTVVCGEESLAVCFFVLLFSLIFFILPFSCHLLHSCQPAARSPSRTISRSSRLLI